jgi:hypothetical protein
MEAKTEMGSSLDIPKYSFDKLEVRFLSDHA